MQDDTYADEINKGRGIKLNKVLSGNAESRFFELLSITSYDEIHAVLGENIYVDNVDGHVYIYTDTASSGE